MSRCGSRLLICAYTDAGYLLVGPFPCVCTVVFALRDLATGGSSSGGVLDLQYGRTWGAKLTEAALEVLVQVAVKNRVEATALGEKEGQHCKMTKRFNTIS